MITPKDIEEKTMTKEKRSEAHNSYFAFYIGRPLSYLLTIPFLYTNISPNCITYLSIICAMIGFVFVSFGSTIAMRLVGVAFFFLWNMGDGIDGNIARYKGLKSANGDLLDTLGGYISMTLILLSAGNASLVDVNSHIYITPYIPMALGGVSAVETLIPRLLMHRKNAMNPNTDINHLKNKASYSIPKIIALNICDPAGFQEVFLLIAVLFHLTAEFTLGYFLLNSMVMVYSIKGLMD